MESSVGCRTGETAGIGSVPYLVFAGLVCYAMALTAITGDIGFEGDDWWIFSWPYWHAFPHSIWAYARDCLRPVEGVYWICLFEFFGFNKIAFHLFSLLLLAGASLLMGLCLARAFPARGAFVAAAVSFAFFLPTVSSLTYVVTTDNSRLSLLFFWASALLFQRWAQGAATVQGLFPPITAYILSFLTYEAPSFLIFAVPLLTIPARLRAGEDRKKDRQDTGPTEDLRAVCARDDRAFLAKLGGAVVVGFVLAVSLRFLLLSGGAVSHSSVLPQWELIWAYLALLPFYVAEPFAAIASGDVRAWLLAAAVAGWTAMVLFAVRSTREEPQRKHGFLDSRAYLMLVAGVVLVLGLLPYQLAGYGSVTPKIAESASIQWGSIPEGYTAWFNFNWSSRIYSSGSFGLAMLLASLVTGWKHPRVRAAARVAAIVAVAAMALFHVGLANDWQQAAEVRNALVRSLISQVPSARPGTNFVFLDLESSAGRAAIFRGWNGLRELMRMLYSQRDLAAWYLYPDASTPPNRLFHQAVACTDGFVTRGVPMDRPIPYDRLLILGRKDSSMAVLDQIAAGGPVVRSGIKWQGASSLRSNPDRVTGWTALNGRSRRPVKDPWSSGLISTLHLSGIKLNSGASHVWGSPRENFYGKSLRSIH
ncbi:MAG: hypothetical protein HY914_20420 [Desulfomonile tiedjei]|nr:hypothetical protein [Desulfomonile tiedjei]